MKKVKTSCGYVAYEVTKKEMELLGSPGRCDECSYTPYSGYLVPVLNHYMCEKCFKEFCACTRYYESDLPIEKRNSDYYERIIPLDKEDTDCGV